MELRKFKMKKIKQFFKQLFCSHKWEYYVTELVWDSDKGVCSQEQRKICSKCKKDKFIKRYN